MNRKILITGGTQFVSRYAAHYFVSLKDEVYVLNRNSRTQEKGVILIEADRHDLKQKLKGMHFDAVLDITAYNTQDAKDLLEALDSFETYVLVSSSAVYPNTLKQPFEETQETGWNEIWKEYGINKADAETFVLSHTDNAYVVRPPYLYGPMQNVYREPFVFDCALKDRPFVLPNQGEMKMQFFHVRDLCRFMDILITERPDERIYNVGNPEMVSIRSWVELGYKTAGKQACMISGKPEWSQRDYFPFYDYEYELDVARQNQLMPELTPLEIGMKESFDWYRQFGKEIKKKPFLEFLDQQL